MLFDRRTLLRSAAAAILSPRLAHATVIDASGRAISIPEKVERVFAAGPPTAILLYTFAPDLLIGWTRSHNPEQCEFLGPDGCDKPEVGRLTGRGNTTNLEVLLKLKPDLILDVGTINDTYISLATRVQEQTGIPYALLDGRFDAIGPLYRKLGELTHGRRRQMTLPPTPRTRSRPSRIVSTKSRNRAGRAFTTGAARAAWKPASADRSMSRLSNFSAPTTLLASGAAA